MVVAVVVVCVVVVMVEVVVVIVVVFVSPGFSETLGRALETAPGTPSRRQIAPNSVGNPERRPKLSFVEAKQTKVVFFFRGSQRVATERTYGPSCVD